MCGMRPDVPPGTKELKSCVDALGRHGTQPVEEAPERLRKQTQVSIIMDGPAIKSVYWLGMLGHLKKSNSQADLGGLGGYGLEREQLS